MLTTVEVAAAARLRPETISRYVREGRIPPPCGPSPRRRLWPESTIGEWLNQAMQVTELPVKVVGSE